MPDITVSGLTWAKRHKRDFDAVITCEDPDEFWGLRYHSEPYRPQLVLSFSDLDEAPPSPYDQDRRVRLATQEQIEQAIQFGKEDRRLLIHCKVGVARSTAVALAILADQHGPGYEKDALEALLAIRPVAVPNLHVVMLADDVLGRRGALLDTVVKWDSMQPDNQTRRRENRKAYFRHYGWKLE